jgi:GH15 family glucan-1,4-alpha-glucosidase
MDLWHKSIDVILQGQAATGAYLASPSFSQYQASWMRDGSLTAYAMDRVGQRDSSRRFYEWTFRTLNRYNAQVETLLDKIAHGIAPDEREYLPTRFAVDGGLVGVAWTDFQLDGYGTWLWSLAQHVRMTDDQAFYQQLRPIVGLICRYLAALWQQPNYDCWEEFREHVHISTLACIYGGFQAIQELDPSLGVANTAAEIRAFVLVQGVMDGHLIKHLGNPAVDANLLWSAIPYRLVDVHDPIYERTLWMIERDLYCPGGGVYRYRADVYYGGGEWLLLAAWLGWVYVERGELSKAEAILRWMESKADEQGYLPEQVNDHMLAPEHFDGWVTRWGTSAKPLLWSHAMYLILSDELKQRKQR